jgi:flavin reductase (DIM6/NTAB) family NADH-FMN oxidoreductase RutF
METDSSTLVEVAGSAVRTRQTASAETFKAAFRNHPGGVTVITADAGGGPAGLTATSVTSVSLDPPMLTFSLSSTSSSTPTIRAADTAVIHLLTADDLAIARLCSTSGIDRFADTSLWSRLPTGEPYFHAASRWIRGKIVHRMSAGDSTILVVEALDISLPPEGESPSDPLVYHNRNWHRLGHASRL